MGGEIMGKGSESRRVVRHGVSRRVAASTWTWIISHDFRLLVVSAEPMRFVVCSDTASSVLTPWALFTLHWLGDPTSFCAEGPDEQNRATLAGGGRV
eukprot:scaffold1859_cov103-Isochrysis_galbana.AAC.5